jgi:hypothetical protein
MSIPGCGHVKAWPMLESSIQEQIKSPVWKLPSNILTASSVTHAVFFYCSEPSPVLLNCVHVQREWAIVFVKRETGNFYFNGAKWIPQKVAGPG